MIAPGSTIGILGGGQLGRMMAVAAAQLGYKVIGYAPAGDNVAAELCHDFFENGWGDKPALAAFAAKCDVVTWEFENVPLSAVEMIPAGMLAPDPRALETAQDRVKEKRFIEDMGGRPAAYMAVGSDDEFKQAVERVGAPGILKTARDGYDGKGQWRVSSLRDADSVRFPGKSCVYESMVDFAAEFSVILVRGKDGEVRFWDFDRQRPSKRHARDLDLSALRQRLGTDRRSAPARRAGRRCAALCRRADARILRHGEWPGVQRNGPAGA